jgi:small subunit ribosomal protein S18
VIQPHDLSQSGLFARSRPTRPPLLGPKARDAKKIDPFYLSGTNPLDMTYHPRLVNAFTNQLGRIRSRAETGLTWKSQRMMGKLIRRQRAMGGCGM